MPLAKCPQSCLYSDLLGDECVGGAGLEDGGQRAVVGEHAAADVHGLQPQLQLGVVQDDDTHLERETVIVTERTMSRTPTTTPA